MIGPFLFPGSDETGRTLQFDSMTRPYRQRAAWLWLCPALAVLAGCAPPGGDTQDRAAASEATVEMAKAPAGHLTTTRRVVNLLDYRPVVDAHVDDGLVGAVDIEASRYFSGGWYHPSGPATPVRIPMEELGPELVEQLRNLGYVQ